MLKFERQKKIEEELKISGSLLISDISQILNCSEETIRRDLKEMEDSGKLVRTHGGAYLPETDDKGIPNKLKESFFSKEKNEMAQLTVQNFISENDTLMLDSSTTCMALAQQIVEHNMHVTIITNSLLILSLFDTKPSDAKLICTGGTYRARSRSFVGYQATEAINRYIADKCFLSCSAIDPDHGLLDNNQNESEVRKAFISHAKKCYFIGDHTKFSDRADYIIGPLNVIDTVITDIPLDTEWRDKMMALEIPVYSVE